MLRRVMLGFLALGLAVAPLAQADDNKALARTFYDDFVNKGNMDLLDELVAEDFVEHEQFPGLPAGREGLRAFFGMMRTAFPDLHFDVQFMVAEEDKVVAYLKMSGTHKGEFMGMPGSGKKFETTTIDIVRIEDGKAAEHWGVTDVATMMEQLGMMPGEGHGGK